MAEKTPRHEMTTRKVVYEIPGMTDVPVRQDIPYGSTDEGPLTFDLYSPLRGARHPVVVFVSGFPDYLGSPMLGCKLKEMASYISWRQLVVASGMSAVTFTSREPAGDLQTLLGYLRQHAEELGIDATRIGDRAAFVRHRRRQRHVARPRASDPRLPREPPPHLEGVTAFVEKRTALLPGS